MAFVGLLKDLAADGTTLTLEQPPTSQHLISKVGDADVRHEHASLRGDRADQVP